MSTTHKTGMIPGITVEMIAEAILAYNDLYARAYTMEWLYYDLPFADIPRPNTTNPTVMIVAAAIVELLATRAHQTPPAWVFTVGRLDEPFFVVRLRPHESFTRNLCLTEAPEPLKRRNIFAPPNYLTFA